LITGGGFPQAKVEEVMQSVGEVPDELVKAYFELQAKCIKFRMSEDDDFEQLNMDGG